MIDIDIIMYTMWLILKLHKIKWRMLKINVQLTYCVNVNNKINKKKLLEKLRLLLRKVNKNARDNFNVGVAWVIMH